MRALVHSSDCIQTGCPDSDSPYPQPLGRWRYAPIRPGPGPRHPTLQKSIKRAFQFPVASSQSQVALQLCARVCLLRLVAFLYLGFFVDLCGFLYLLFLEKKYKPFQVEPTLDFVVLYLGSLHWYNTIIMNTSCFVEYISLHTAYSQYASGKINTYMYMSVMLTTEHKDRTWSVCKTCQLSICLPTARQGLPVCLWLGMKVPLSLTNTETLCR